MRNYTLRRKWAIVPVIIILSLTANRVAAQPGTGAIGQWGQVQYLRQLAGDTTLLLRSDLQLSTTSLVPLEQFGLGGIQSVRGYRQDALLADNGLFASAELRLPILRWRQVDGLLSFIPFVDFGTVGNKDRDNKASLFKRMEVSGPRTADILICYDTQY